MSAKPRAGQGAREVFRGLVVADGDAAGLAGHPEAALDEVAQTIELSIHGHAHLSDLRMGITGTTLRAAMVFDLCQSYEHDSPAGRQALACCCP